MLDYVRADLLRAGEDGCSVPAVALLFFNLGVQAVLLYRLAHWLHTHGMPRIAAVLSYVNAVFTGAQISARATIGKGLAIYHPRDVVIGASAVIGAHCTLVHNNLIGQLQGGGDRPVIGDNFFAATGSKIMGRITIGNDVSIGPNAVVIQSLPDGVTVAGNPARIVFRRTAEAASVDSALPAKTVVERVIMLVKQIVELGNTSGIIDESTPLLGKGIGLDSIEVLRLLCALEEEFNVTLDEREVALRHLRSVGTLAAFIATRVAP